MISDLLVRLKDSDAKITITGDKLFVDAPENILTPELLLEVRLHKAGIILELQSDLNYWLAQVRQCTSQEEVFSLLDKFRPLSWSDKQRAEMSHTYHEQLGALKNNGALAADSKNNQPVADNAYWINIKPLIACYPTQPPGEILSWIMQSVMAAPTCDQACWFKLLEQWRGNFHDKDWADEVFNRLIQCDSAMIGH